MECMVLCVWGRRGAGATALWLLLCQKNGKSNSFCGFNKTYSKGRVKVWKGMMQQCSSRDGLVEGRPSKGHCPLTPLRSSSQLHLIKDTWSFVSEIHEQAEWKIRTDCFFPSSASSSWSPKSKCHELFNTTNQDKSFMHSHHEASDWILNLFFNASKHTFLKWI